MIYTPIGRFKSAVSRGLATGPEVRLLKAATVTVEPAGGRRKLFTISTPRVDREGDTVSVSGWDLEAYMRSPVVLWNHDFFSPPIGKTVEIGVDGAALKAVVEFVPPEVPGIGPQAEMVYQLCDLGFLSAASVGFRPLEFTTAKDRMTDDDWLPPLDFQRQELLEWSVVTIPANPDATAERDESRAAAIEARKSAAAAEDARLAQESTDRAVMIAQRRRQLRAACY